VKLDELTVRLTDVLKTRSSIWLVYLFGSQAEGSPGPKSDYDFAVLLDRDRDDRQLQAELAHELAIALKTELVDVVVLNRAPVELAYAVIANGRLLYERDVATRVEYEAKVLGLYGDYLPVLRQQREDLLQGDDHVRRVHRYREAFRRTERALGEIRALYREAKE
jgi:uncharacterized protein